MKKFFEKKVVDYKFRRAGQGHRLDEERARPQPTRSQPGGGGEREGGRGEKQSICTGSYPRHGYRRHAFIPRTSIGHS